MSILKYEEKLSETWAKQAYQNETLNISKEKESTGLCLGSLPCCGMTHHPVSLVEAFEGTGADKMLLHISEFILLLLSVVNYQ